MMQLELKILQKTYDMILYAYPALKNFPRSEKHTLVAEIKTTMYAMIRLIVRANKERDSGTLTLDTAGTSYRGRKGPAGVLAGDAGSGGDGGRIH